MALSRCSIFNYFHDLSVYFSLSHLLLFLQGFVVIIESNLFRDLTCDGYMQYLKVLLHHCGQVYGLLTIFATKQSVVFA